MKEYTEDEKNMLQEINEIGIRIGSLPEAEDLIFAILDPYLGQLMRLLKQLQPTEMEALFIKYEGIMKVMRIIEDCAQQMERELGLS